MSIPKSAIQSKHSINEKTGVETLELRVISYFRHEIDHHLVREIGLQRVQEDVSQNFERSLFMDMRRPILEACYELERQLYVSLREEEPNFRTAEILREGFQKLRELTEDKLRFQDD